MPLETFDFELRPKNCKKFPSLIRRAKTHRKHIGFADLMNNQIFKLFPVSQCDSEINDKLFSGQNFGIAVAVNEAVKNDSSFLAKQLRKTKKF